MEIIEQPYFSGFEFVQFEQTPNWARVLDHSVIFNVLKSYKDGQARPYVFPEHELERLRQMEEAGTFTGQVNYAQVLERLRGTEVEVPSGVLEGYTAQISRVQRNGTVYLWAGRIALTFQFAELFGMDLEAFALSETLKDVTAKALGVGPPKYQRTAPPSGVWQPPGATPGLRRV
ncbi:hypothetical protein [Neomesorhizobium albiziae]|uniref:hypothetical protein n=1 Tax=Neomesorhizobium albiziae TaxID=335020 RepID=UPI00122CB83F|nr:hypothetical protein [Mesorhizobium albiziae]GLS28857.1 hypothetical protein GCM10007937_05640 [Mesorhizobium albiziae]